MTQLGACYITTTKINAGNIVCSAGQGTCTQSDVRYETFYSLGVEDYTQSYSYGCSFWGWNRCSGSR